MIGPRMPHRITVFHPTGSDVRGNPTGTTTENVRANVTYEHKVITNASGAQVVSLCQVETEHKIEPGDIVTLPDRSKGTVIKRLIHNGLGGKESHREAYL